MTEVEQLTHALRGADPVARAEAAERLAQIGPDARVAAVALVESLEADSETQEWAVSALEDLGPPRVEDVSELMRLLEHDHELVGYWASTLLGRRGHQATEAVGQLARTLGDSSHPSVRQRSAWALGKIGAPDPEAVKALTKAASNDDARLSRLAQSSLDALSQS